MKISYNLLLNLIENYKKYGILYHGTSVEHDIDMILPPDKTSVISEKGRKKNLDKVFFTADYKSAVIYAKRAVRSLGGVAKVYESAVVITPKLDKIIKDML